MVGYSEQHSGDCYRMWHPTTKRVHTTGDVIWLRRMFYLKPGSSTIDMAVEADEVSIQEVEEGSVEDENANPESEDEEENNPDQNPVEVIVEDAEEEDEEEDSVDEDAEVLADDSEEDAEEPATIITRTGRISKPKQYSDHVCGVCMADLDYRDRVRVPRFKACLNEAVMELENHLSEQEILAVGAGIGGGFTNTQELRPMKYSEAMNTPDAEQWAKAVDEEYQRMLDNKVWKAVDRKEVPKGAKMLSSTWAMKKKSNGKYRARINARGFEQIDGKHYNEQDKAAPVVNEITIRIFMVLIVMAAWCTQIVDVKGAFLLGSFKPEHEMYMEVPQGFEKYIPAWAVLLLGKTIYGTKQAALQFWRFLVSGLRSKGYSKSAADACLYYQWTNAGFLTMAISWVDDCLLAGPKKEVLEVKAKITEIFNVDDQGEMEEYIGCKVEHNKTEGYLKFTQPVLMQSFEDEFELPKVNRKKVLPAPAGTMLKKEEETVSERARNLQKRYWKVTAYDEVVPLRYVEQDSGAVYSKFVQYPSKTHLTAMYDLMLYVLSTPKHGNIFKPERKWDGKDKNFKFRVSGKSDSDYNKEEGSKSVSGWSVFLEKAAVAAKSRMQQGITLSVTEAETMAAVECAQDMLFTMHVLQSIGLTVELPMILEVDNKGTVDLANNWSSAGRTRHICTKIAFLRELKEEGILKVQWTSNVHMSSDIFTKNVGGADFRKHVKTYCGDDEYNK